MLSLVVSNLITPAAREYGKSNVSSGSAKLWRIFGVVVIVLWRTTFWWWFITPGRFASPNIFVYLNAELTFMLSWCFCIMSMFFVSMFIDARLRLAFFIVEIDMSLSSLVEVVSKRVRVKKLSECLLVGDCSEPTVFRSASDLISCKLRAFLSNLRIELNLAP